MSRSAHTRYPPKVWATEEKFTEWLTALQRSPRQDTVAPLRSFDELRGHEYRALGPSSTMIQLSIQLLRKPLVIVVQKSDPLPLRRRNAGIARVGAAP